MVSVNLAIKIYIFVVKAKTNLLATHLNFIFGSIALTDKNWKKSEYKEKSIRVVTSMSIEYNDPKSGLSSGLQESAFGKYAARTSI